jgi:hypothetical protein
MARAKVRLGQSSQGEQPPMTALNEFDRLEATALWRPEGETQRVEVIVSMGKATLVICDLNDKTLAHWSLPAVERINGANERTAIYQPGYETDERLETEDETMIAAISRVQRAIERATPRPGRLRTVLSSAAGIALIAAAVLWLPDALVRQAVSIVPDVTRTQIGDALLLRVQRLSGQPCNTDHGTQALQHLETRLNAAGDIVVLRGGVQISRSLPGGTTLLNRSIVEDFEDPDVLAGYVLAEQQRTHDLDPLAHLLNVTGLRTTITLLTSGKIADATLDTYAETLLSQPMNAVDAGELIERFAEAQVHMTPYAYAQDITGERTLALIEADPVRVQEARAALTDGDWVALQGICNG